MIIIENIFLDRERNREGGGRSGRSNNNAGFFIVVVVAVDVVDDVYVVIYRPTATVHT